MTFFYHQGLKGLKRDYWKKRLIDPHIVLDSSQRSKKFTEIQKQLFKGILKKTQQQNFENLDKYLWQGLFSRHLNFKGLCHSCVLQHQSEMVGEDGQTETKTTHFFFFYNRRQNYMKQGKGIKCYWTIT